MLTRRDPTAAAQPLVGPVVTAAGRLVHTPADGGGDANDTIGKSSSLWPVSSHSSSEEDCDELVASFRALSEDAPSSPSVTASSVSDVITPFAAFEALTTIRRDVGGGSAVAAIATFAAHEFGFAGTAEAPPDDDDDDGGARSTLSLTVAVAATATASADEDATATTASLSPRCCCCCCCCCDFDSGGGGGFIGPAVPLELLAVPHGLRGSRFKAGGNMSSFAGRAVEADDEGCCLPQ